jgi:hypothetical protein
MVDLSLLQSVSYIAGALGVCVAASYYVMVLREQRNNTRLTLETRQSQLFMQIYTQSLSRDFIQQWYKAKDFDYKGLDDFGKRYSIDANPEFFLSFISIGNYLDGLGVLVKRGMMDIRLISDMMGSKAAWWWRFFEPYIRDTRMEGNAPDFFASAEFLVNEMMRIRKEEGSFHEWTAYTRPKQ